QLEQYMQRYLDAEGISFEQWITRFGAGAYFQRNQVLLEMLCPRHPRAILELACAGGFLADLLLKNITTIERYTCSNFSPQVVTYCNSQLAQHPQCEVANIDADVIRAGDLTPARLAEYDAVITTSFEHIQY